MSSSVLVVDDQAPAAEFLRILLEEQGHEVVTACNGVEALVALEARLYDVVVSDLQMPEMDGLELLAHVKQRWPEVPVIIVTALSDIAKVVQVVQLGAINYLIKPASPTAVIDAVQKALLARTRAPTPRSIKELVGTSKAIVEVRHLVALAARSDVPVLITGETGTGKELVARAIHRYSTLSERPFVAHNCALTPRDLFESQYFGHRRGSFTGADRDSAGLLVEADGGVLFLDELEALLPEHQAKLLRVLDDGEVRPVGGERSRHVSVRFVAATNRDPRSMLSDGTLRDDLYYRLRAFEIALPPLHERRQDVPSLAAFFVGSEGAGITPDALDVLSRAPWPGNVRQLRNVIQSAKALAGGAEIGAFHLPRDLVEGRPFKATGAASHEAAFRGSTLRDVERQAILQALADCDGNRTQAAKLLDIDRSTLRRKIREYEIEGDA